MGLSEGALGAISNMIVRPLQKPQAPAGSGQTPLCEILPCWTSSLPSAERNDMYWEPHLKRLCLCVCQARAQSHWPGARWFSWPEPETTGQRETPSGRRFLHPRAQHRAGAGAWRAPLRVRARPQRAGAREPRPGLGLTAPHRPHPPPSPSARLAALLRGFSSAVLRSDVPPELAASKEGSVTNPLPGFSHTSWTVGARRSLISGGTWVRNVPFRSSSGGTCRTRGSRSPWGGTCSDVSLLTVGRF